MAQILSEEEDDEVDEEDVGVKKGKEPDSASPSTNDRTQTDSNPVKRRKKQSRFLKDFASLMISDFTRDLVLVIELEGVTGPERFKFVAVRNKIDTASDENFISYELLEKHRMDSQKILDIPEEQQRERTLEMLDSFKFVPKKEVKLEWHRLQDKKQRENTFIIVENAPFDVLIGSKQFSSEARQSVLFIVGRHKSKGISCHHRYSISSSRH
jgi:hypothetical protein